MRERLLERVALRVREGVAVLVRVRLVVDVLDGFTLASCLEDDGVAVATLDGVLLGCREVVAVGLANTVRLAEAGRETEVESDGVDVKLTDGDAEDEDDEEPEEVSELELLDVPDRVDAAVVMWVG